METCCHKGCRNHYKESENFPNSCRYHPGEGVFHDGTKKWSCCPTTIVYDFDDWMKIPGCQTGSHEKASKAKSQTESSQLRGSSIESSLPDNKKTAKEIHLGTKTEETSVERPSGKELEWQTKVADKGSCQELCSKEEMMDTEKDLNDPDNAHIPGNALCKRRGCGYNYASHDHTSVSENHPCYYHPGLPIFHEGSKGYACCSRRVLEFDAFLKIKGCKSLPRHRYLETNQQDTSVVAAEKCRYDWYQTLSHVVVSLFCKDALQTQSQIQLSENEINATIQTIDHKVFHFHKIDVATSSTEYLKSKVEISLKKKQNYSWVALEFQEASLVKSFTTFGVSGGMGSVGAKEAILAPDVHPHLMMTSHQNT